MANYGTITINTVENTSFIRLKSIINDKLYKFEQTDTNYLLKQIIRYQKRRNAKYPAFNIIQKANKISISLTDIEHLNLIKNAIPKLNPESIKAIRKNKYSGIAAIATATAITLSTVGIVPNVLKKSTTTKTVSSSSSSLLEEENFKKSLADFYTDYYGIYFDAADKIKTDVLNKAAIEAKKEATTKRHNKSTNYSNNEINLGNTTLTADEIDRYETTANKYYDLFEKYGKMYGIDPLLISYIATQERGEHSEKVDKGGGIGLCQIQISYHNVALEKCDNWQTKPFDVLLKESLISEINAKKISAYNFETGKKEEFISMSSNTKNSFNRWLNKTPGVIDTSTLSKNNTKSNHKIIIKDVSQLEDNIQYSAMIFSQHLKTFNGNIKLALFAYNQGADRVKNYIKNYAKQQRISYEEAMNTIPDRYLISAVPKNYGDRNYLNNVLRNAIASKNSTITCYYKDQNNETKECHLTIKGQNLKTNNRSK